MFETFLPIVKKELNHIKRDKYTLFLIIFLPIIQLVVTGLALQKDIKHLNTAVFDQSNTAQSRKYIESLELSQFFDIERHIYSQQEGVNLIKKGKAQVVLVIPEDFDTNIKAENKSSKINIIADGTNAGVARVAVNMANLVTSSYAIDIMNERMARHIGTTALQANAKPIDIDFQVLYNPDLKSSYFVIPGLLAVILQTLTMLFTAFAIVRERERGTLEQLMVTPVKPLDLMCGKILPYLIIGLIDMLLSIVIMVWVFEIHISGSFWFLTVSSTIFLIASLASGILISTISNTQVHAIQITFAILIPTMLLTGFLFPLEPMPFLIKCISYTMPLTYYLEIIRGVVLKGAGFYELWIPSLILVVFTVIVMYISISRFRKKIA